MRNYSGPILTSFPRKTFSFLSTSLLSPNLNLVKLLKMTCLNATLLKLLNVKKPCLLQATVFQKSIKLSIQSDDFKKINAPDGINDFILHNQKLI